MHVAPALSGRQGAPLASFHPNGALDHQGLCRGRIQLLYIYFIACTVTLGGDQKVDKVDDTPAPPCDLAGLDLIFITPSCPACPIDMACVLLSWPQCTISPVKFSSHRAPLTPHVSAPLVL